MIGDRTAVKPRLSAAVGVRLPRREIGRGAAHIGLLGLIFLFADRLGGKQLVGARQLGSGVDQRGICLGRLGLRLGQRGGIGARIDDEERLTGADALPVAEQHAIDRAGNARAHLHVLDRLEPADIFVPVDHVALQRDGDGDLGQGGRRLFLGSGTGRKGQDGAGDQHE